MECSNVHKISSSSVLHFTSTGYVTDCWVIAIKFYVSTEVKSDMRELWPKRPEASNELKKLIDDISNCILEIYFAEKKIIS